MLLIGIVKKNAIMMIDFALEAERKEHKPPLEAIYQACLLRFRPIMMTTMAALLGGIPLALGSGSGSELRRPLGIAIVGGLIFSQLLTLYTTPVIYLFFDRLAKRFSKAYGAAGGSLDMNPSELFIRRPVATTLLLAGVALSGAVAFRLLPVSPLPQVDFPTISVSASLARGESGNHGIFRGHAAGTAVREDFRRHGDDIPEQPGEHQHHFAVRFEPQYRCGGARCAGGHQRGPGLSSADAE